MRCEICQQIIGHDIRCPNYIPEKSIFYCSYCEYPIFNGEEYIENYKGEFRHYDCFHSKRELLKWIGSDIKIMEENYE